MKKIIFTLGFAVAELLCLAQSDIKTRTISSPLQFHSINSIGLLEGQNGAAFQLQTINGLKLKDWFGGIGVGIDHYSIRTVPIFLDIRRKFSGGKKAPFAYADGGANYVWLTKANAANNNDKYSCGFYLDAGFGYTIETKKSGALVVSLGYTQKSYTQKQQNWYYTPIMIDVNPLPSEYTSTLNYTLRRVSVKVGWDF